MYISYRIRSGVIHNTNHNIFIKVSPSIELIQQSTGCDEYYKWVIMKTLTITTELLPTFGPIL